jgi:hypothetical protein
MDEKVSGGREQEPAGGPTANQEEHQPVKGGLLTEDGDQLTTEDGEPLVVEEGNAANQE